jgi:hypothetical protein
MEQRYDRLSLVHLRYLKRERLGQQELRQGARHNLVDDQGQDACRHVRER